MLNKMNHGLTLLMASSIGVFIGHSLYTYWDYLKYPELYALQSAPWYTEIIIYGFLLVITLVIILILKVIIKRKINGLK